MNADVRHKLIWGWLRLFLGVAQMWLAGIGLVLLVSIGLRPATLAFVLVATVATIVSRLLHKRQRSPTLQKGKQKR